ncbi:MAG: hypothetical protein JXR90_04165 [Spirochaetes bacterium]|nr:hypothetical protein [Spirochaetota bacterium]
MLSESLLKLKEEFTSVWTLLNDTSRYLTRVELFTEYENMLRKWRAALQKKYRNPDVYRSIKRQIIDLRKQLRKEGHDLRLASMDIELKGFKSDDAQRYGFKRAVLYLSTKNIAYTSGDDNHSDLSKYFERRMDNQSNFNYSYLHSIWFRWRHNEILEIAGSDSETREQYAAMQKFINNNKLYVLKKIKDIH